MDDGLHGALRGVAVQDHAVALLRLQVDLFLLLLRGERWRKGNKGSALKNVAGTVENCTAFNISLVRRKT